LRQIFGIEGLLDYSRGWLRVGRRWFGVYRHRLVMVPVIQGGTSATLTQEDFRFRNDDGSLATATWIDGETTNNINKSIALGTTFRLRFVVQGGGKDVQNYLFDLWCSKNSGTYFQVTSASTLVQLVNDANSIADHATTQQRIGNGTYSTGDLEGYNDGTTDNTTGAMDLSAGTEYEVEVCVQILTTGNAAGNTFDFRLRNEGVTFNTYSFTPRATAVAGATTIPLDTATLTAAGQVITVVNQNQFINLNTAALTAAGQVITINAGGYDPGFYQHGFRIRKTDGQGLNAAFDAGDPAENVNTTIETGQVFRVRFRIGREGVGALTDFKLQVQFNAGSWTDVNIADDLNTTGYLACLMSVPSSQFSDAAATSALLTGGGKTFTAGEGIAAVAITGNILTANTYDLDNLETEFEWCLIMKPFFYEPQNSLDQLQAGDTLTLRVVQGDGTVFPNTYTSPVITVAEGDGVIGGTTVERPNRAIFEYSGSLYALMEDNGVGSTNPDRHMVKSTDRGATWRLIDDANNPAQRDWEASDAVIVGSVMYIGSQLNNDVYHDRFNLGTDTWDGTIIDEAVQTGVTRDDQTSAIERRSDGSVVQFWQEQNTNFRIRYKVRNGSWGTVADLDSESGVDWSDVWAILGASDLVHIFYNDNTNGNLYHRSLSSSDVLGARDLVHNDTGIGGIDLSPIIGAVHIVDPTPSVTERILVAFRDESDGLIYTSYVDDDGTPSSVVVASDNAVAQNGIGGNDCAAALINDGQIIHLFYADVTNRDIYYTKSYDYGATWATDAVIVSGAFCSSMSAVYYEVATAGQVGILYDESRKFLGTSVGLNSMLRFVEYQVKPADSTVSLNTATGTATGQIITIDAGASGVTVIVDTAAITAGGQVLALAPGEATTALDTASLAAGGQALSLAPGEAVVNLNTAALMSVGQVMSFLMGETVIPFSTADLNAIGQVLGLAPGEALLALATAAAAISGQSLAVVPGAATTELSTALITAFGPTISIDSGSGAITIPLNTAGLTALGQVLGLAPGEAIAILNTADLTAGAQVLGLVPGEATISATTAVITAGGQVIQINYAVNAVTAALTASGQALSLVPGEATILASTATITAGGQTTTVVLGGGAQTIPLNTAIMTADGQILGLAPGEATVSVSTAVLTADGQITQINYAVNAGTASVVANGQPLTVVPGEATVGITTANIDASGQAISITLATLVELNTAGLTAGAQAISFSLGAVTTGLSTAGLTADGQALGVVPGEYTVVLDTAALIADGQATALVLGEIFIGLGTADLSADGQTITISLVGAPVTIPLNTAALIAGGQVADIIPGPTTVGINTALLSALGQDLGISTGAVAILLATASLDANGQDVALSPGAVSLLLETPYLTASGQSLAVVPGSTSVGLSTADLQALGVAIMVAAAGFPGGGTLFDIALGEGTLSDIALGEGTLQDSDNA
jgi:hypothetical protein